MNNLTSKIYLLVLGLLVSMTVSAQQITGVVKDTGGQPLAGVSTSMAYFPSMSVEHLPTWTENMP